MAAGQPVHTAPGATVGFRTAAPAHLMVCHYTCPERGQGLGSYLLHFEQEDPVADPGGVGAARRLEGDPLPVRADHRVRGLVTLVVAPAGEADKIGAVGLQLQLPDIDIFGILAFWKIGRASCRERV